MPPKELPSGRALRPRSDSPPAGHESNWLPAPTGGNFEVTPRMYGPAQSVIQDTYA